MTLALTPHGDMASCMTSAHRCPRTKQCWRYQKPAMPRQTYADFAGGADCADFIAILGEVA
jgi:hypothetical protein